MKFLANLILVITLILGATTSYAMSYSTAVELGEEAAKEILSNYKAHNVTGPALCLKHIQAELPGYQQEEFLSSVGLERPLDFYINEGNKALIKTIYSYLIEQTNLISFFDHFYVLNELIQHVDSNPLSTQEMEKLEKQRILVLKNHTSLCWKMLNKLEEVDDLFETYESYAAQFMFLGEHLNIPTKVVEQVLRKTHFWAVDLGQTDKDFLSYAKYLQDKYHNWNSWFSAFEKASPLSKVVAWRNAMGLDEDVIAYYAKSPAFNEAFDKDTFQFFKIKLDLAKTEKQKEYLLYRATSSFNSDLAGHFSLKLRELVNS